MAQIIKSAVDESITKVNPSYVIKSKQLEAIRHILNGSDTLAILPTSYGKSLIYQLIPAVCRLLSDKPNNAIVIVISPLMALIKDQVDAANKMVSLSLRATDLNIEKFKQISNGQFNVIVDTPEAWLDDERWKAVLLSHMFRKNVVCIVVDEAHKVSWGKASVDGVVFCDAFSRIGDIRSFCSEHVPVLALSATVDKDYRELVNVSCSLSSQVKLIYTCCDRPNIRLSVVKLKEKSVLCFDWVFNLLKDFGVECPKILIYCRTQLDVGFLFEQFLLNLNAYAYVNIGDGSNVNRIKSSKDFLIGMYHADTDDKIKEKVLGSLVGDCGNVRVTIATSALGCGINCKDVKYVAHFGPSFSLVDYCQQIGRAGRNSQQNCHAILYHYPQGGSSKIQKSMKEYLKTTTCLRSALFTRFNENEEPVPSLTPKHLCCSICADMCVCLEDNCVKINDFEYPTTNLNVAEKISVRCVTASDREKVQKMLENLHSMSCSTSQNVPSGFVSGLTSNIINDIVLNLQFIDSVDFILKNFLIINKQLAINIFGIIKVRFREAYSPPAKKQLIDVEPEDKQYEFGDLSSGDEFNDEEIL